MCDGLTCCPPERHGVAADDHPGLHLLRNRFRSSDRGAAIAKPAYSRTPKAAAKERITDFAEARESSLPGGRAAVGQRLARVRAVPRVRSRGAAWGLFHQLHPIGQCAEPPHGQGARPTPNETRRAQNASISHP